LATDPNSTPYWHYRSPDEAELVPAVSTETLMAHARVMAAREKESGTPGEAQSYDHIERALKSERADAGEPVSVQVLRVLRSSLRESQGAERMPTAFLVDASRQYVTNEVRANYIDPISMFSNILPPIGFIGTLIGLVVLVLSKESGSETLELVGLAGAVSKSIRQPPATGLPPLLPAAAETLRFLCRNTNSTQ
jgi:hypothetical protein